MVRGISPFFYTLEFLIALSVFLLLLVFYVMDIERNSLFAFLIAGVINTGVELLLQGLGIRVLMGAYLFSIPIGFPYVCFILGFMEGGVKTVIGYNFVKLILNRTKFNQIFTLSLCSIIFVIFYLYAAATRVQFQGNPLSVQYTARKLFGSLSTGFLILVWSVSVLYFATNKDLPKSGRQSLLYYMGGQLVYLMAFTVPLHLHLLRYIGYEVGVFYIPADIISQIFLMYGYFLLFEGIGVNIVIYPIIVQMNLIEFN